MPTLNSDIRLIPRTTNIIDPGGIKRVPFATPSGVTFLSEELMKKFLNEDADIQGMFPFQ
jgi:hypothetical protein